MFDSRKFKVVGVGVDQHSVDTINQEKIHMVKPDLDMLVKAVVTEGYIRATTKPEPADASLIAVPTPFKSGPMGDHQSDKYYIEAAANSIAPVLKKGDLVILESTSSVGVTEQMSALSEQARLDRHSPKAMAKTATCAWSNALNVFCQGMYCVNWRKTTALLAA